MKKLLLVVPFLFAGCVSKARHQAVLNYQASQCEGYIRNQASEFSAFRKTAEMEKELMQLQLRTQIVNNDEILRAAEKGELERAKELQERSYKLAGQAPEGPLPVATSTETVK